MAMIWPKPEMTSTEFRTIQAELGWSGTFLAGRLGLAPDTISRMRFQDRPIRGPVVLAMKALASGWRP